MTRYETIMSRVQEHYNDALKRIPEERIIGIFLEGSQNYGIDLPESDVDTKLFIFPSIDDIIFNKEPISTTWIRENNEHISVKDIRLIMNTFRKQNLNFLEILFTKYNIINPTYSYNFNRLIFSREIIARYNPYAAIQAMSGIAYNKYKMIFKESEATIKNIEKFGYDPKQLCHLKRIEYFLKYYLDKYSYMRCIHPSVEIIDELIKIKTGLYSKEEAKKMAEDSIYAIDTLKLYVEYNKAKYQIINKKADYLMNEVQKDLIMQYLKSEVSIAE